MAVAVKESSAYRGVSSGGCRRQTEDSGVADMTCCGRLFQTRAATMRKAMTAVTAGKGSVAVS